MSHKKRRSLGGFLNPFSYFMGNDNGSTIDNETSNDNNADDEKSVDDNTNESTQSKLKNNTQLQYLSAHSDIPRCLCVMDKDRFASAGDDCLILIWSINNGLLLDVLCGHSQSISCLQMIEYQSSSLLISASLDHTIRIWNVSKSCKRAKCISILKDHNASIIKMLFSTEHRILFTASNDGYIALCCMNPEFDIKDSSNNKHNPFFILSRMININIKDAKDTIHITQMIYLHSSSGAKIKQLIIGCSNGHLAFIQLEHNKNDHIKWIQKHRSEIKYIYQSCVDRFISASYDGLICVWRIESHLPHQLLERINDIELEQNAPNRNKVNHLRLNCFIDFMDEYGNKYFIVSFANSFVIFDSKFLVKCMVKNVYDEGTEIIAMDIFGKQSDLMLITANNKQHMVKLWSLSAIHLESIKNGIWLSCFHQELLYDADVRRGKRRQRSKKHKHNNKNKNMVHDLCIDSQLLFENKFPFHSKRIIAIQHINHYTFASYDEMNQIILWKNAYYVSNLQNQAIKRYFNLI